MKKLGVAFATTLAIFSFFSCANQFNQVYKSSDYNYKYEYAKESFFAKKYARAIVLFSDVVTLQKGTENGQECLYLLGLSQYLNKDYAEASKTFRTYCNSYPKGLYAENAKFYIGQSLYMGSPESRLDQTPTLSAITAFQDYLDNYPNARNEEVAHKRLFALQDKLVQKELHSAQLYYDLGTYFGNCTSGGNNYEACIITAQNALKDYPYTNLREDFALLIMKSKFELAQQSIESKKQDRFQDAEDECYGFINEYPNSKYNTLAQKYILKCKEFTHK